MPLTVSQLIEELKKHLPRNKDTIVFMQIDNAVYEIGGVDLFIDDNRTYSLNLLEPGKTL